MADLDEIILSEADEENWYALEEPTYNTNPPSDDVSLARRFVSQWLEVDNQNFTIPANAWGVEFKGYLHALLAATSKPEQETPGLHIDILC